VAAACGIVLIPGAPLGVFTVAVQALAGVLLPSASVFLLLLCNDRQVLGPWVNKMRLNALATVILGVLFMLSGILVVTTVFPHVDVTRLLIALSIVLGAGGLALGVASVRSRASAPADDVDRVKGAYREAVAVARERRDRELAAAGGSYAASRRGAKERYEEALRRAGDDPIAAAEAKADRTEELALARADHMQARALAANAYTRAEAAAAAERDKGVAAAKAEARTWTMPPLALLGKPEWSRTRVLVMAFMWGYLAVAVALLVVKAGRLAGG